MQELNDYCNNFKTILELGKLDNVLFKENEFLDKDIFFAELKSLATENYNNSGNPVLNEDQFLECINTSKLKTLQIAIDDLVEQNVLRKIVKDDGTVVYEINDIDNFPEWLNDII